MQIEIKKENEARLQQTLKEIGNVKLRNARSQYDALQVDINSSLRYLKNYYKELKECNETIQNEEQNQTQIGNKLMDILNLSKVKQAYYDTDSKKIVVSTHTLYFRTLNGGRYRLGHATITFDTGNFNVRFDTDNKRRSYWSDNCPHPHVSHRGEACLGNTGELIVSLQSDNEFGLIFDILIAFLEQANTDDCAGRFAMNWDKVDEEGNVIQEGYKNKDNVYFKYGETPEEDRFVDGTKCACCGEILDEDDETYQTMDGETICESCRDEYYAECEECGDLEHRDNMNYIEDIGYVCEDCTENHYIWCEICEEYTHEDDATWIESEQRSICAHCRDKHYIWCEECEEWHSSDETTYVESVEKDVCDDCLEEYYEKCCECGEYFFRGDMYAESENNVANYYCDTCHKELMENKEIASSEEEESIDELVEHIANAEPFMPKPINEVQEERCDVCGKVVNENTRTEYNNHIYCMDCIIEVL